MKLEMSKRYYFAEATVWLLGAILLISQFVGLKTSQPVPILNIILENKQDYPRVVAALLGASALYFIFAWKQSSRKARASYWLQVHAWVTILWVCVSLWLSYPLIAAKTDFAVVSPAWFLGFLAIGFLLGQLVSVLALSTLMIRTSSEAETIKLPRIPIVTRAQYRVWIPVIFLLLGAYIVLWHYSPEIIKELGLAIAFVPFLFIVGEEFAWLCMSQDENGTRIPLSKRVAGMKEVVAVHDYASILAHKGREAAEELGISTETSIQEMQNTMQEKYALGPQSGSFQCVSQEELQLKAYPKDRDKKIHPQRTEV